MNLLQLDDDWKANSAPEKVQSVETKWAKSHTTYYAQLEDNWKANSAPEKVSVTETKHAKTHTTYYDKKNSLWRINNTELPMIEDDNFLQWDANMGPEKVHELIPEAYNKVSNSGDMGVLSYPHVRTAFYVQTEEAPAKFNANQGPEKVHVLETKHAKTHTTYYDKQNGLWRMGAELAQFEDTINNSHIDPAVHDFVAPAIAAAQSERGDTVSPSHMDPWVHDFVSDAIAGKYQYHAQKASQSEDLINNSHIDPWVYETSAKAIMGEDFQSKTGTSN